MNRAARRRGLYFLAALCLLASVALSAHLLVPGSVAVTPGGSHDIVTPAPEKAPLAIASNGHPTDRSQDRHFPDGQQPAGLGETEDWPAKKFLSGFPVLSAPFEANDEYAGWKPEPTLVEVGSDSPPQLLQRPPPAG